MKVSIYYYWLVLVAITLSFAIVDSGLWYVVAILLTIIKVLCVTEQFMGLKHASKLWRLPLGTYGVLVPLSCALIIYL